MRFLQAVIFLALLLAIGVFAVQNTGLITINFLTWNLAQPVALVTIAIYLMGMLSGWSILGFMRRSLRKVTQRPAQ